MGRGGQQAVSGAGRRAGVLLANIGTPESPSTGDVRRYLGEFLMDARVIGMPFLARWLLVHGIILRTRPRKSAAAYRRIWTDRGSPLLLHGLALAEGMLREMEGEIEDLALGMRYGSPSIASALDRLAERCAEILVVPLFPQHAASTSGSISDAVAAWAARRPAAPPIRVLPAFHGESGFLGAFAAVARPALEECRPDRVLMSFHGLPESHLRAADPRCLREGCCDAPGSGNRSCYRAQCFATARALARRLGLGEDRYEVSFQSRLSRAWIRPFTDRRLRELPGEGVRRLLVLCPSFVADCLETLEEIGIAGRDLFLAAGGEEFRLVSCPNADPSWVAGLAAIVRSALERI
ncbi:MAG: ferrochelatase [Planctomycetota bacterium]